VFEKPPEVRAERSTLVIGRKSLRNSEGKIVLTVVYFHEGETRLGNAQPPRSPEDAVADIHGVVSSFEGLQSRKKQNFATRPSCSTSRSGKRAG
jgi:hypothetical protein